MFIHESFIIFYLTKTKKREETIRSIRPSIGGQQQTERNEKKREKK
jgi:hypothetical protein